jgi:hypothetical protein
MGVKRGWEAANANLRIAPISYLIFARLGQGWGRLNLFRIFGVLKAAVMPKAYSAVVSGDYGPQAPRRGTVARTHRIS